MPPRKTLKPNVLDISAGAPATVPPLMKAQMKSKTSATLTKPKAPTVVGNATALPEKTAEPRRVRAKHGSRSQVSSPEVLAVTVNQDTIALRAYYLWLERGCPQGTAEADWLAAEVALLSA